MLAGTIFTASLVSLITNEFGVIEITFISELMFTLANAFPEKTVLLTVNPFDKSGYEITPLTIAAFKLAAVLGATDFPL